MMRNTINEIKNILEGINSRITEAEGRISDLEDKIVEVTAAEDFQGSEDTLYATLKMDICHHAFVQTQRMYTKSES